MLYNYFDKEFFCFLLHPPTSILFHTSVKKVVYMEVTEIISLSQKKITINKVQDTTGNFCPPSNATLPTFANFLCHNAEKRYLECNIMFSVSLRLKTHK